MEIRDRFKRVRTTLGLSQAEMGEKLSLERSVISLIERKKRNLTDRSIRDLCRELNISYIWLTDGIGEMFINEDIDYVSRIDRIMSGENEFAKATFKMFVQYDEEDWAALHRLVNKYLNFQNDETLSVPELIDECPKTPEELEQLYTPVNVKQKVI